MRSSFPFWHNRHVSVFLRSLASFNRPFLRNFFVHPVASTTPDPFVRVPEARIPAGECMAPCWLTSDAMSGPSITRLTTPHRGSPLTSLWKTRMWGKHFDYLVTSHSPGLLQKLGTPLLTTQGSASLITVGTYSGTPAVKGSGFRFLASHPETTWPTCNRVAVFC